MTSNIKRVVLCVACLSSVTPAFAAPKEMPQGQRDEKSMTYTEKRVENHRKDNQEADKNVDSLIKNRK